MNTAASCFLSRDRRPIYEWASDNVTLRAPYTRTGPFDVSISRHFIKPFEALADDHCREVNILKPVRGGGTLIADIWAAWQRANDPGPFMFVLQSKVIADDHSIRKVGQVLRSVPSIREMIESLENYDRHKVSTPSIEFPDGNVFQINGPSPGNLQTNAFRYLVLDECWLYDNGRMVDAEGRIGDYLKLQLSKILRVSQAGSRDFRSLCECDWNRAYHAAATWEWTVQCMSCGHRMQPEMSGQRSDGSYWGLNWDKHKRANGDWDIDKCVPTVRFECEKCAHPHTDCHRTQAEWNRTGEYVLTTDANRKRQSFRWNALIDWPWTELCQKWLEACNAFDRGEIKPKIQVCQKLLTQFMDEEKILKRGLNLTRVTYEASSDWPDEKARFMSVDKQDEDKYWWTVRAWSENKTRRLGFGLAIGAAALEEIRKKYNVPPNRFFIDSGWQPKGDRGVYLMCIKYGWIAVKGDKEASYVHRDQQGRTVLRSYAPMVWKDAELGQGRKALCRLIRFSKQAMNQAVQSLIDSDRWEEPVIGLSQEMEEEYNAQMSGRIRKTEFDKKTHETKVFWMESPNDHARDLANMQCLGAIMIRPRLMPDPATDTVVSHQ